MGQVNRISKTGLELVKGFEGLRRRSEPLTGGGWIVGYGHTRSAREGVEVTEREAEYLLRYDLQEIEKMVSGAVHAPLNQNEFDALVSFAWNVGRENFHISDVLKYVNAGEMLAAAESFSAWRKARVDGRLIVVDALVRRRAAEKHLFLSHPAGAPNAPSQIIRPELDVAASVLALSDGALSIETKINGDGTIQRTVKEDVSLRAANSNDGLAAMPLSITPAPRVTEDLPPPFQDNDVIETSAEIEELVEEDQPSVEDQIQSAIDALEGKDQAELEPEPAADADAPSIWDATDEAEEELAGEYSDLDEYEDTEEDAEEADSNVDDSLLAAAVIASNLSRRDDETAAFPAEGDDETDQAVEDTVEAEEVVQAETQEEFMPAFVDLSERDEPVETDFVEDVEIIEVEVVEAAAPPVELTDVDAVEVETPAEPEALAAEAVAFTSDTSVEEITPVSEDQELIATDVENDAAFTPVATDLVPNDAVWPADENGEENKKKCIVDPLVADHFPDEIAAMDDEGEGFSPVSGGRRSGADVWVSLIPFVVLVVLGAVMGVFGIFDWWGLISSEIPVDKNQLYAGPFLTLIGGLGFLFGIYFIVRKMMGVED